MKKNLKLRKNERLCDWCDRLADYIDANDIDRETLRDILGEVSKWSYIHGSNDYQKAIMRPRI